MSRQILAAALFWATSILASADTEKRIAITFDDAPRAAGALMSVERRTSMLIDALETADTSAMFFVTTGNLESQGDEGHARLRRFVEAGHTLANHSHAHRSANAIDADDFVADIAKAQSVLDALPGVARLFRFPFLHEGNSVEKRDQIRAGLDGLDLRQGYVTIDNYDWYLQALFDEAIRTRQDIDLEAWREVYVDVLMQAVNWYERVAQDALGRSPAHVLLLHENDLAALFVDDLIARLRREGWEIVSAEMAYDDPLANQMPDTLRLGQGRVAAWGAVRGMHYSELQHPLESESALRAHLVRRGLVGLKPGAYLGQTAPGLQPQVFAPGIISLPDRYEFGSVFSADGTELFFAVSIDGRGQILSSRFTDGEWQTPSVILSEPGHAYADPFLSRDESRLYFISTRGSADPETKNSDLWFVQRTRRGWSEPQRLGDDINTSYDEFFVSISDAGELAFASNRDGSTATDFDVYIAHAKDREFSAPQRLQGDANTRAYEADPFIAPDGSYILFSSTRVRGQARDLFATFRQPDGTWSRGISLGDAINTDAIEFCPFVTRDGRFLFYSSNRDIYWVDAAIIDLAREQLSATNKEPH